MDYISTVENLVDELSLIEGGREIMLSSIAWSQAVGVFNLIHRLQSTELTPEQTLQTEATLAERKNVLGWAAMGANREFLPTWDTMKELLSIPAAVSIDQVAAFAEEQSVTKTKARAMLKAQSDKSAEESTKTIIENGKEIRGTIERCLSGTEHETDFSISRYLCLGILNKIADKMFERDERSLERAAQYVTNRRISRSIATERQIYNDVQAKAEEAISTLEKEEDQQAHEPFGAEGSKMH